MSSFLSRREVVLVGAGHTNVHVLDAWRTRPIAGARLTCVSEFPIATYSGMLPGVLAGQYAPERMEIDLPRLCAAVGAEFVTAKVTGLDVGESHVLAGDHPPLSFDVLSIGVGSLPDTSPLTSSADADSTAVVLIKPMQTFLTRLESRLAVLAARDLSTPLRVAVVGGGAGGIEIAFCLPRRLRTHFKHDRFAMTLVDRNRTLLSGASTATSNLVLRRLRARGVELLLGSEVLRVAAGLLNFSQGSSREFDLIVWATQSRPVDALSSLHLPTDERGFLLTKATLQSTAAASVFAVGDAGTIQGNPTPKAGVYAVRQGPVLWENIQRLLDGRELVEYQPQRGFLSLLNTGDGRAILSWKGLACEGGWCWWLKDYIDSRFIARYQP